MLQGLRGFQFLLFSFEGLGYLSLRARGRAFSSGYKIGDALASLAQLETLKLESNNSIATIEQGRRFQHG